MIEIFKLSDSGGSDEIEEPHLSELLLRQQVRLVALTLQRG